MFTSGFTEPAAVSETMQGETVTCKLWRKPETVPTGSLVIAENDTFITDWFVFPLRNQYYDKDICLRFLAKTRHTREAIKS
jgi:hypothetical protein